MSWVFVKNIPTVILTCRRNLESYYISKLFVILPQNYKSMNNIPIEFLQSFNAIDMYNNYLVVTCTTFILSIENTLKNIYLSNNCFTQFQSTLLLNKDVYFSY